MPSLNRRTVTFILISLGCLILASCSRYQMTFNDAVVYQPKTIFTDFRVADLNLQQCLDQAIKDEKTTKARDLQKLICSHAGITDLAGIEIFSGLSAINLSHNQLQSIGPLTHMPQLKILLLNDNQLKTAAELLTLQKLTRIDLSNNSDLDCGDLLQLKENYQGELQLPEQCL